MRSGRQCVRVAPDHPADARIHEPVLVPRRVDGRDAGETEVPLEVRVEERRDHRAGRAVGVHGHVDPGLVLERVERVADLLHGLVRAVEGRAEDRDDADRVLVAELHRLLRGEREASALHRDEAHLDVPVVRELLPADLDVDAHDEVRLVDRLALGRAPLLPAPLEREPAEHGGLAGAGRRAAGRRVGVRRVPEVGEDVHAARLDLGGLRVLVLVDHVLVEALGHELLGLRLHPRRHERGHVQPRVAVEHQLVVDDLVRDVRRHLALRKRVAGDGSGLEGEVRRDCEIVRLRMRRAWVFEHQRVLRRRVARVSQRRRLPQSAGPPEPIQPHCAVAFPQWNRPPSGASSYSSRCGR